jgi:hypothetical protein
MITLTGKEIKDLAEFAGFLVDASLSSEDELETEFNIYDCPPEGVRDDDGIIEHYAHCVIISEYPEEGCCPLGEKIWAGFL